MGKINIAEILKNCPKGTKLYSPLCGECKLIKIYDGLGFDVVNETDDVFNFSYDGRYNLMGECCIFPAKTQRDWSKFQRPFKDGDVLVHTQNDRFIMSIYKSNESAVIINTHAIFWDRGEGLSVGMKICCYTDSTRFATEEEKQKLFDAIKAEGYHWNSETKTLEKLIEPKFKVGDRIKDIYFDRKVGKVVKIHDKRYELDDGKFLYFQDENAYEISNEKFDILTLKPFDKVLVRNTNKDYWMISMFGYIGNYDKQYFMCIANSSFYQCIPYEGNEHLLGTTNDCDEYYKTW